MSIFTAYFCGTGSTRYDTANPDFWNGELVSTLAHNDQGRLWAEQIAVDGPGSGNLQDDDLFVKPGSYFNWTGQLFGRGWEENVAHVVQVIKGKTNWQRTKLSKEEYEDLKKRGVEVPDAEAGSSWFWRTYDYGDSFAKQELYQGIITRFRKPLIPTQINLVGWSRGGISCHMLANALASDPELKHIPVNIFAIDPVPGVGNIDKRRVQLASNVKEYVGFYSRDERSKGFACVIPSVAATTHIHVFPMHGRHATLVGNASVDGAGGGKHLDEPGLLVRHFAEVCLTRWGVKLNNRLQLSDIQLMQYHKEMIAENERYTAMRKKSYTVVTEGSAADRFVHLGTDETSFSKVTGSAFKPSEGLALERVTVDSYKVLR
jgi:hypothetical protein